MKQDYKDQKQSGATMLRNLAFGIIGAVILLLWTWIPDFALSEEECNSQRGRVYLKNLCSELKTK